MPSPIVWASGGGICPRTLNDITETNPLNIEDKDTAEDSQAKEEQEDTTTNLEEDTMAKSSKRKDKEMLNTTNKEYIEEMGPARAKEETMAKEMKEMKEEATSTPSQEQMSKEESRPAMLAV